MPISPVPNDRENIKYLSGVIINGGIAFGVAVTWAFGKPFIKNYVEDNVDIEGATHPTVMHMIKRLTTMWLSCIYLDDIGVSCSCSDATTRKSQFYSLHGV